ncbi:hypothetical protein [Escherichia albertii]|uniref:hypothetical protein n=1 Tax=Escherichia albertii TaxID=208962 RepID=UPI0013DDBF20|nr:hypothetical protein [Escherichia albertii]
MLDFVVDGEGEEYSGNGENSYLEMRDFLKEIFGECGASGRMTHWRSPFGPLLKQRYPSWCRRLLPPPLPYLHR